jgi:hypothetical protein
VQFGQSTRIFECVFREACAFTGFYFVAVNTKEAIMADNLARLNEEGRPLRGVAQNGNISEITEK